MISIEPGERSTGVLVYRFRCDECGRIGSWLTSLSTAERCAASHQYAFHPKPERIK